MSRDHFFPPHFAVQRTAPWSQEKTQARPDEREKSLGTETRRVVERNCMARARGNGVSIFVAARNHQLVFGGFLPADVPCPE